MYVKQYTSNLTRITCGSMGQSSMLTGGPIDNLATVPANPPGYDSIPPAEAYFNPMAVIAAFRNDLAIPTNVVHMIRSASIP